MKTTIDIPDVLYRSMKARCASMGTTMRHVTIALYGDFMQRPDWVPRIRTEHILTEKPAKKNGRRLACFGVARPDPNLNVSHDWDDIQKSIEEGWAEKHAEKEKRILEQREL